MPVIQIGGVNAMSRTYRNSDLQTMISAVLEKCVITENNLHLFGKKLERLDLTLSLHLETPPLRLLLESREYLNIAEASCSQLMESLKLLQHSIQVTLHEVTVERMEKTEAN